MKLVQLSSKSDVIGAWASTLCLVHCLATPFLFVVHAGMHATQETHPSWWGALDVTFLTISLFAIIWTNKTTSKKWMGSVLWASWILLAFIVFNEKFLWLSIPEIAIYLPTLSLIFFHIYNRRYCQCGEDTCCANG